MASFDTVWAVTSSWEGAWKPYEKRDAKADSGDYLPTTKIGKAFYVGTSYGLTGEFMRDYRVMSDSTIRKIMPNMSISDAGAHWRATRWVWMSGDAINDQDLDTLIFDYFVQSNQNAIKAIAEVLMSVYKGLNVTQKQIIDSRKYKHIDPKHPNPEGGFMALSAYAIEMINGVENPLVLFNLIRDKRVARLSNPRTKSFIYGNIKVRQVVETEADAIKEEKKKKLHGASTGATDLSSETHEGGATFIKAALAVFVGGKNFKWW